MLKEFREFALRGNVIDMAIGIIVGSAFGSIITSLVTDIIMPPIGLILGGVDFSDLFVVIKEGATPRPYPSLVAAQDVGAVTMNIGLFMNTLISFLIIAFSIFLLIRGINKLQKSEPEAIPTEPSIKKCPYCVSEIPIEASRCPHCTSNL